LEPETLGLPETTPPPSEPLQVSWF
jgi:hypothetical protein